MLSKLSFSLLAVIIAVMMAATLVEKVSGSAADIYGSWWFASLWAVLAVSSLFYMVRRHLHRRPAVLLLHLSFVVILIGALITHLCSRQGQLHLRLGYPVAAFQLDDGRMSKLPFEVELSDFDLQTYPGTDSPMDYVSVLRAGGKELTVSMNNIGACQGYRFYQSAYDPDLQGTVLAVAFDPWGIAVTYVGYGLLFLSLLSLLLLPDEGFRQSLKRLSVVALLLAAFAAPGRSEVKVLPDSLADRFCQLYAYHNGRICPLQTVACDFTTKLYGHPSYRGYSAEQVFMGWLLFPSNWKDQPLKKAKNEAQAREQQAIIQMLFNGQFLHIYPYADTCSLSTVHWFSPADNLPMDMPQDSWFFIKKSMDYVGELAVMHQYDKLSYTIAKIRKFQRDQAGDVLPSDVRFRAECCYNTCNVTRPLAMAFATLGIVLFGLYLWFWLTGRRLPRVVIVAVNVVLTLSLLYQTAFWLLRWYVSGHLPLTNGHETMLFLSLLVMLFTLLLQRRFVLVVPFGFLLAGMTLLVSMMGQSNPQITPLMPVLSSPLLSVHVCIIMVAYALLAFVFLNGVTALFLRDEAKVAQLTDVSRVLLYPALFCMAGGIFVGAIWANVSWGRYWGWDPKEVWALITLLVYCFAFHTQSLPLFRRPKFFHLYMVLAFLTVLMTYFGVNFILGGMHSYAAQ